MPQYLTLPEAKFQFTLPRGERLDFSLDSSTFLLFQFTLPRGERRYSR